MKNVAIDLLRRRKKLPFALLEVDCPAPEPPQETLLTRYGDYIEEALNALPSVFRIPLVLHYLKGMSHRTIAQSLKLRLTTVNSRLETGRKLLCVQLRRLAGEGGWSARAS